MENIIFAFSIAFQIIGICFGIKSVLMSKKLIKMIHGLDMDVVIPKSTLERNIYLMRTKDCFPENVSLLLKRFRLIYFVCLFFITLGCIPVIASLFGLL